MVKIKTSLVIKRNPFLLKLIRIDFLKYIFIIDKMKLLSSYLSKDFYLYL